MIEILNPAWLSVIVDGGRYGYADVGVPPSAALDGGALTALNGLLENGADFPAIEVMGSDFRILFHADVRCAITGARASAFLDDRPVAPWSAFSAPGGSVLRVREVPEGLRYYIGFSARIECDRVIGSHTTNIECRFGGYHGRPLMKGDTITLADRRSSGVLRSVPESLIPSMAPPHLLRVTEGPEWDFFTEASLRALADEDRFIWWSVSTRLNRTGIRLEGEGLAFREEAEKSIISEGVLRGAVQVPGDGMPIIVLDERTIGGYSRVALVARVDLDRLAHLKPRDAVAFQRIPIGRAEALWEESRAKETRRLPQ